MSHKVIYLDHAATTPIDPEVLVAMEPHVQMTYGNPSSIHQIGRRAFDALQAARQSIADSLGVQTDEIIFTGSGTESDNLAVIGLAHAHQEHGRHVILSALEHKAVLEPAHRLETEGFTVTYVPVDEHGQIILADLEQALTDETTLISVMYANNEIGTIQPIQDIVALVQKHYQEKHRPLIHTDACQAPGMLQVKPTELGVDAMTLNSSKIYGPKGIGLLYLKTGTALEAQIIGGAQEGGQRAGTENVALAIGFAKALEIAVASTEENHHRLASLQTHFLAELRSQVPTLILNGHPTNRLPNNVHLCIPDIEGESILLMLDAAGICAATGSACNAADLEPSHVLRAIGRDDDVIHGSLRFSFGPQTTLEELTYTAKTLGAITKNLLSMTASSLPITTHAYAKRT